MHHTHTLQIPHNRRATTKRYSVSGSDKNNVSGDQIKSIMTPSFNEISRLAAQAGYPAEGDTPKNQKQSEFSFAGMGGLEGEATNRSR